MSNVYILAFSTRGYELAKRIANIFEGQAMRVTNLSECVKSVFYTGNVLVFVGAAGIAVRGIAPYIKSKTTDPAVLVIDELGNYVIPILSGHIGGANEYARKIAAAIYSTPVITTATDINNVFSIDTFAVKNNCYIVNPEIIKHVSAALLENKQIGLRTDYEIKGNLPKNIDTGASFDTGIYIGSDKTASPFRRTLCICPKIFHVGIGVKKNTEYEALHQFFIDSVQNIPIGAVASLSSIDLKKDEPAITELSKNYNIKFITYTAEELSKFSELFSQSDFVKKTTGVGNVCETSAYISAKNGIILQPKKARDGMTIAIAQEFWRITFE